MFWSWRDSNQQFEDDELIFLVLYQFNYRTSLSNISLQLFLKSTATYITQSLTLPRTGVCRSCFHLHNAGVVVMLWIFDVRLHVNMTNSKTAQITRTSPLSDPKLLNCCSVINYNNCSQHFL